MFIAGDVGGTKVILALFEPKQKLECVLEKKFKSRDFPDFLSILKEFLKEIDASKMTSMCFGVAGPVSDGRCEVANLPWIIDAKELGKALHFPKIALLNDLEANAWGLQMLTEKELCTLNTGKKAAANQALISAGTGLGEAGLYWDGKKHCPFSSEGGHADFSPRNELEIGLLRYLQTKHTHVSFERVLSGAGLYQIYRFLVDVMKESEHGDVAKLSEKGEPQKVISELAIQGKCKTSVHAVEIFVSIYGAESGNLALKFLSRGGLFIGGGIAPHLVSFFQEGEFMRSFTTKGRFAPLLSTIPVHIVLNEKTALLGAARYAQERG